VTPSGRPSVAARWEAAQRGRLAPTRPSTPGGDVEAETRLYRDVAGTFAPALGHPAELALRTRVVDAQVAHALGRGVEQVVLVGAGYDGRALRFGDGSTRWFEVDRPSVLADKDARLRALGIAAANRRAVAADLGEAHGDVGLLGDLGDALEAAGHRTDRRSLFVCEGVLAALALAAAATLCETLRARAAAGSTLVAAFPVFPDAAAPARAVREATGLLWRAAGESRRDEYRPGDPEKLLVVTGWRAIHTEATAEQRLDRGARLLLTVSEPAATPGR
jgi:methyltransferase (TIGR00027 family)